jgi:hypothetical protein
MKNPPALILVLLGSLAMAVATFLPLNESGTFRRIEDNTLIQNGGWVLIALAIWISAAGYYADQGSQKIALVILPCVIAGAWIVFTAISAATEKLYPIGADGNPDTSQPGSAATTGIGIYLAGVGTAVALTGALMLRKTSPNSTSDARPARPSGEA